MEKLIKKLLIVFFIISCSGGGGSAPTDSDGSGNGDTTNPYELPNAINYNIANQVEVVTWNIRQFPQHSTSVDYVKNLLEKWNADIYFFDKEKLRDAEYLMSYAKETNLNIEDSDDGGKVLFEIFEKTVEHELQKPTYITSYPKTVSPLSRANDEDPWVVDRFEFFIAGRELANGFQELNDPEDQAQRFEDQVKAREGGDDEAMFFDQDYIEALEYGMPPTAGLGVGIDRLIMLFADQASIRDVLFFPHMRNK